MTRRSARFDRMRKSVRPPVQTDQRRIAAIADGLDLRPAFEDQRSEEHTSELQSLMRISYAVFCLKTKPLQMTPLFISTDNTLTERVGCLPVAKASVRAHVTTT